MTIRYVVIGDSHVTSLAKSIRRLRRPDIIGSPLGGARMYYQPFFEVRNGEIEFTLPETIENFGIFRSRSGLESFSAVKGGLVLSIGLAADPLFSHETWVDSDFGPTPNPGKRFVSYGVIEEVVRTWQAPGLAFYRACAEKGILTAALAPPPLQRAHGALKTFPREKIDELTQIWQKPVRLLLEELGCPIISASDTTDEDGYLKEEFYGKDHAHANTEFGVKHLQDMFRVLEGEPQ